MDINHTRTQVTRSFTPSGRSQKRRVEHAEVERTEDDRWASQAVVRGTWKIRGRLRLLRWRWQIFSLPVYCNIDAAFEIWIRMGAPCTRGPTRRWEKKNQTEPNSGTAARTQRNACTSCTAFGCTRVHVFVCCIGTRACNIRMYGRDDLAGDMCGGLIR
jgi:hypothetical protein